MKLSVITVCYNVQSEIKETIESVLMQDCNDFEYIVIDGNSNDNTYFIISQYADDKRIKIYSEDDFGIYNAMNRGICRASGEYIYFLNAGDTFYDNKVLKTVSEKLQRQNTIYYGTVKCKQPGETDKFSDFSKEEGSITDKFLKGVMPCHQAIFAPRGSLRNHFFYEMYKLRADYQWFYDSIFNQYELEYMSIIVANYNMFGESTNIANMEIMAKETQQIQKLFFDNKQIVIPQMELKPQTEFMWKKTADKHLKIIRVMDSWLLLKQNKISLKSYFQDNEISRIAIYGLGYIGLRLVNELKNTDIIQYAIDEKKINIDILVKNNHEKLDPVDAIVITTVNDYEEVIKTLNNRIKCKLIRIDEIIQFCMNQYCA